MSSHPVNIFGETFSILSRSLDLRARQHEITLANIANADTPGYTPFSLNVERALQESAAHQAIALKRTNIRHLSGNPELAEEALAEGADPLLFRGDENGVDVDLEMTRMARNTLLYRASGQMVGSKLKGLKNVITGGGAT
ncbi:flagellar basal body rod protein FlgB [Desulfosarcina sp. OttesenSCG-928-G10]|nr:flagellar basal body rod protein FlgB [Desulfosarcina sp. OttesenSCG-928-G10]MDL2322113.1 flagellar basal body rod protein FlgB [Desulfosarcina sp. OttesenSCG-928-B08]